MVETKQQNIVVEYKDLGLADYKQAWDEQERLFAHINHVKTNESETETTPNYLLFCEHPHVYTLGRNGSAQNLLLSDNELQQHQATFYHINRGGDITYHGPGQLVGYPVLDLDNFGLDIRRYVEALEQSIIDTLQYYNIKGERLQGASGVWLDTDNDVKARKICAIGVRASRKVTMHGFALNVNTDLDYFSHIVPCGIPDKGVTSLQKELGTQVEMKEVKQLVKKNITTLIGAKLID